MRDFPGNGEGELQHINFWRPAGAGGASVRLASRADGTIWQDEARVAPPLMARVSVPSAVEFRGSARHVLVVDDDPALRAMIADYLAGQTFG